MIIEKGEKMYSVRENKRSWSVSVDIGKLRTTYSVPKEICKDADELKSYIMQEKLF